MSFRTVALCALLLIGAAAPMPAMAQRTITAIEAKGLPADDAELRGRVTRMRTILDDANARFTAPSAAAELRVLRRYAGKRDDLLAERRDILSMLGTVISRSATIPPREGLDAMAELMTLEAGDNWPIRSRMYDRFAYARLAGRVAAARNDKAGHLLAAEQYGKAAALADQAPDMTDDQRAGIREKQAYELHEAGRYEEALALNRQVLARGETMFGPNSTKLMTVLTNIAQNLHALGRGAEAEPYLLRVQTIAEADQDMEKVQEMLFQRGVLAYELGRPDDARRLMQDRIRRLRGANMPGRLTDAEEDYRELERRISGK